MAGQKQRHDFIVQLAVGHALAFVVLRLQHHAQQVAGHLPAGAALPDDSVDHFVELLHRALQAAGGGNGNELGQQKRKPRLPHEFAHQDVKRGCHVLRFLRHIVSNSVLATMSSVSRIMASWTSSSCPSRQDASMRCVNSTITSAYAAMRCW